MIEDWRAIAGYEGMYEVSSHGRVKSLKRRGTSGCILKYKKHKKTPPGLAKKKKLPPGLQKQLVKRGKLPPGLQGRGLAHELERQLTPLPRGYVHMKVGGDVIILNEKTRVVVDVVYGLD